MRRLSSKLVSSRKKERGLDGGHVAARITPNEAATQGAK